ncbi:MAG: hypothetical protein U0003_03140 [Vampirovibrionales bacterium]
MTLSTTTPNSAACPLGLSKGVWWAVFLLDTVGLSQWLQAFKVFTLTPSFSSTAGVVAYTVWVVVATAALIYDGYAKEWCKGTIRNAVPWLERLIVWQQRLLGVSISFGVASSSTGEQV